MNGRRLVRWLLLIGCVGGLLRASPALAGDGVWTTQSIASFDPAGLVVDAAASTHVYAFTRQGGVLESRDGGTEWSVSEGMPPNTWQLAFDPLTPSIIYAVSQSQLMKRGADNQWSAVATGVLQSVRAMMINPEDPNELWVNTDSGLFRSADGGQAWASAKLPANGEVAALGLGPRGTHDVYAAVGGQGLFHSADAADTWTQMPNTANLGIHSLAVEASQPGGLFAASDQGLLHSDDHGATWKQLTPNNHDSIRADILVWTAGNGGTIYATSGDTFYRSSDRGGSWQTVRLIEGNNIAALVADPQTPAVLYALVRGLVVKTADGGATWKIVTADQYHPTVRVALPADPSSLLALDRQQNGQTVRSADGGQTWKSVHNWPQDSGLGPLYIDPMRTGHILAGAGKALLVSDDSGQTWQATGMPTTGSPRAIAAQAGNGNTVLVSLGNLILRSSDGGRAWSSATLPGGAEATSLWLDRAKPQRALAATQSGLYGSDDGGASWQQAAGAPWDLLWDGEQGGAVYGEAQGAIVTSEDGGRSWDTVGTACGGTARPEAFYADAVDPKVVFARCSSQYFVSSDAGASWVRLGTLPIQASSFAHAGKAPALFYVTDQSQNLWRLSLSEVPAGPTPTPTRTPRPANTAGPTATPSRTPTATLTPRPRAAMVVLTPPAPQTRGTKEPKPLASSTVLLIVAVVAALGVGAWLVLLRPRRRAWPTPVSNPLPPVSPVSHTVTCPYCGRANSIGSRFCMGCGQPLPQSPGAAAPSGR